MNLSRSVLKAAGAFTGALVAAGLLPGPVAAARESRPADNGASIIAEQRINDSTIDITIRSKAVDADVKARVLLPKGWQRDTRQTYPTVYLYGGGGGDDHTIWDQKTDVAKLASRWNTIVVMPFNGMNGGFVNWYNYGAWGKPAWETHHTFELRQLVERNLHAGTSRAVFGVSAGSLGAMAYAGRQPGLFKYVAGFSGILHTRKLGLPPILMLLNSGNGTDPFRIWGVPGIHDDNWRKHDPYELAARLRGTGLYVSAGTTGNRGPLDPANLNLLQAIQMRIVGGLSEQICGDASRSFAARLRQLKIPVTTHFYGDGWHSWPYWNRETHRAWPLAMRAIGAHQV